MYFLLMRKRSTGIWTIETGGNTAAAVQLDLDSYVRHHVKPANLRILSLADAHHTTVMAAVNALNNGKRYPAARYHYTAAPWKNTFSSVAA